MSEGSDGASRSQMESAGSPSRGLRALLFERVPWPLLHPPTRGVVDVGRGRVRFSAARPLAARRIHGAEVADARAAVCALPADEERDGRGLESVIRSYKSVTNVRIM